MSDKVIRLDAVSIPKVNKTAEGYLRGEAVVTRAGIFPYLNLDGSIRYELRHPDNVFHEDSLKTLKMIPVTDNHPSEFVTSSNAKLYQKGFTGEVYKVVDHNIIVSVTITHDDLIESVLSGKCELSLGYYTELLKEDGEYEGQRYDYRQLNPIYNHLAVVLQGRAGRDARLRTDKAFMFYKDALIQINKQQLTKKEDSLMTDLNKDTESEVVKVRLDALTAERDLIAEKYTTLQKKYDGVSEAWERTKKELESLKSLRTDDLIEQKVKNRLQIMSNASKFLKNVTDYVRHTDREIMIETLNTAKNIKFDYTDYSDDVIRGMFLAITESSEKDVKKDTFEAIRARYDASSRKSINDAIIEQMRAGKTK